jgi:uncharacterized cupin superfamily protein
MAQFAQLGVRVHVLPPGEPNGAYHAENQQEDFLVLAGECRLLVEGEERTLRQWDFFHAPAGTEHIFVGAGEEPCAILMVGSRSGDWSVSYPVSELAAGYGASAKRETPDPDEVYADWEPSRRNAFGRQVASFEADLDVGHGDEPVRAVFIRAPWIEDAGPGVQVLAEVDGHPVLAREGRLLVAAFHPELTDDTRIHEIFLNQVREGATSVRA